METETCFFLAFTTTAKNTPFFLIPASFIALSVSSSSYENQFTTAQCSVFLRTWPNAQNFNVMSIVKVFAVAKSTYLHWNMIRILEKIVHPVSCYQVLMCH